MDDLFKFFFLLTQLLNTSQFQKSLIFSCVLHLGIAALLFLFTPWVGIHVSFMPKIIQVDIVDSSYVRKQGRSFKSFKSPLVGPPKGRTKLKLPVLGDLGVNMHRMTNGGDSFSSPVNMLHGFDVFTDVKTSGLYRTIFEKIDRQLVYPAVLQQEQITGTVSARIFISKAGELISDKIQINSSSKFLTVLVARTLRKAFEQPLTDIIKYSDHEVEVFCSFQFEITEHNDLELVKAKRTSVGNQLVFYRHFQRSALEWQIGPLSGVGPIPAINVLWFPQKISDALSNKAKIDPLQSYRDDPAW